MGKTYIRAPKKYYAWIASIGIAAAGGLIFYQASGKIPLYPLWLASTGVVTFILYGFDKLQAKRNAGRVPEIVLHLLALVGGFIGGWAGRFVFRHKTRKPVFLVVLILASVLHVGGWFYFR